MGIWNDDARYQSSYLKFYEGYYLTGDSGYIDKDGYVWVMGRMDGVINVAGHRLSTGEMEEVIAKHPEVPMGFVVLKEGIERDFCYRSKKITKNKKREDTKGYYALHGRWKRVEYAINHRRRYCFTRNRKSYKKIGISKKK